MPGWSRRLIVAHRSRIACTIPRTPSGEDRHERSRPQYQSDAGEPTLRRKNPLRRIVPLAGGARQKALPHARRCAGIRRTKGKPEKPREAKARPPRHGTTVCQFLLWVKADPKRRTFDVRFSATADLPQHN